MSETGLRPEDLGWTEAEFAEFFAEIEQKRNLKELRKNRPWVRDIIRVLWGFGESGTTMTRLVEELLSLRHPSGLPTPKKLRATIQSAINSHTSQSKLFKRLRRPPSDDLFYSPKERGTWAVNRSKAAAWLQARRLPEA
jgi:hypothetical protein